MRDLQQFRLEITAARAGDTRGPWGHMCMREFTILGAVTGSILAAGASLAQISAEHVRAGSRPPD
jgi:hypothetical protein